MSERTLKNNDEVYSVTIRDYKEGSIGKSLQSEIVINCKNYTIFCDCRICQEVFKWRIRNDLIVGIVDFN